MSEVVVDRILAAAPRPHPVLRLPSREDVTRLVDRMGVEAATRALAKLYSDFEAQVTKSDPIKNPKFDALEDGWVLPHWWDAVRDLNEIRLLYFSGGRRASKSQCCGWLFLQSCLAYPGGYRWCLSDSEATSVATQHPMIWHYLRRAWKDRLNNKESAEFKLKYQEGRGFTDMLLVLPTKPATTIKFLTKGQRVTDYQGWKLGGPPQEPKHFETPNGERLEIPNIGAWIDEDITLDWLNTAMDRSSDQRAKVIWSFTPLKGITQTVRETLGTTHRLLQSRPAPLLPQGRRLIKEMLDLPPGQMPYRVECARPNARAIFFFKDANPWSGYEAWCKENVHLDEASTQREGYGWTREIRGRQFPRFGAAHILDPQHLPVRGTNYRFIDPHPGRMWAVMWVRVWPAAGGRLKRVIYRDWPDIDHFGEWAVPTTRSEDGKSHKGSDGDPGPAQENRGLGIVDYKKALLGCETVRFALDGGHLIERDPYRLSLVLKALADAALVPDASGRFTQMQIEDYQAENPDPVREEIAQSYFDPRAHANPMAAEQSGTTLGDLMFAEQRDAGTGRVTGPSMMFEPAFSGKGIDDGVDHVNNLLAWDDDSPDGLVRDYNDPRLYVASHCYQVRWMFDHYTGLGGPDGACKEWADLARYCCQTDLMHYTPTSFGSEGGGSY